MIDYIINLMAESLEKDKSEVKETDLFRDYEEWDSLAYLSVIAAIDDAYGIVIPVEDFRSCKSVKDVAEYVEKHKE